MRVKLDENLGERGRSILVEAGHDVETVAQEGLLSASDEAILARCKAEKRCLLTLDLDFSNPIRYRPSAFAGIAVLRLPRKPRPGNLERALALLADALGHQTIEGKLWIVQRDAIREYEELPAGPRKRHRG